MINDTEVEDSIRSGSITEQQINDLLERKLASDRADGARGEFERRLAFMPAKLVAAEVDAASVGVLSPAEAERLKTGAQKLIDERMAAQATQLRNRMATLEVDADTAIQQAESLTADFQAIAEDSSNGLMEVDNALDLFGRLDRVVADMERQRHELQSQLEPLSEREADPDAYFDQFERRYPMMRTCFAGRLRTPQSYPGITATEYTRASDGETRTI